MRRGKIRVLVVEDSPTARAFLTHIFNAASDMEVVATATDGDEALQAVRVCRPDVVTMDVNMPRMSGLDATRQIMRAFPVPIVVVSGVFHDDVQASFQALDAGALAFVRKPPGADDPSHADAVSDIVQTVRLMSEVRVVRRKPATTCLGPVTEKHLAVARPHRGIKVVAIGASTGGPSAIRDVLCAFDRHADVPILMVQHIAHGFLDGFVSWLTQATGRALCIPSHDEAISPGQVYLAPDGRHMGVNEARRIVLSDAPLEHGLRPAVSWLFRSVRAVFPAEAAAVLLSGMGKDGASELLDLRQAGSLTFAQDRESATVFGMPGEAIRLGAAQHVMTPSQIGAALTIAVETVSRQEKAGKGNVLWPAS